MTRPPRRFRPRSIRTRLVLISTVLATVAVLVSQAAGMTVMRGWLTGQIDDRLGEFRPPPLPAYVRGHGTLPGTSDAAVPQKDLLPSDYRVFFYDADGTLLPDSLGSGDGRPRLPGTVAALGLTTGKPATLPAEGGDGNWRVVVDTDPQGRRVVVALPLDTVEGATSKLLWFSLAIGAVAAAGVGLLSSAAVRLGLRPLARMERTALRITAGESALVVTDTDPRTETGRLGIAFNTMLDQVRAALHRKDASERRLRRFMADAGHELRTPLTSVQGFAELLVEQPRLPAARRREAHELIVRNSERMSRLVDDLFLLAKLGYAPVTHRESVDLLSLAADGVRAAVVAHPEREVRLAPLAGDGPEGAATALDVVETLGDPHQLAQVIANLLANACVHTPPGASVEVRVGTALTGHRAGGCDRPGRTSATAALSPGVPVCVVEVVDDGPGLAPDAARQAFERFYRGPSAADGPEPGSGLGLAIASTIATAHQGRLELDTRPGYGSTFRLLLPRGVGPESATVA
ncbi:sensor histidine kinase [Streptomyces sp. NPDC002530]